MAPGQMLQQIGMAQYQWGQMQFNKLYSLTDQQIDNFLTFADDVGGASNKFNGVDVTVNARLRDVTLQGGTSSGNVVEDSCGVVNNHPEAYIFSAWGGTDPFLDTFLGGFAGAGVLSWALVGIEHQAAAASTAGSPRIRTCMTFSRRRLTGPTLRAVALRGNSAVLRAHGLPSLF
jgi:hypothetical protein